MKIPPVVLRRFEWRLGLRRRSSRAPEGMTRLELDAVLGSLPSDVDPDELLEFVRADEDGSAGCPVFRERLRRLLWSRVGRRQPLAAAWMRLLN